MFEKERELTLSINKDLGLALNGKLSKNKQKAALNRSLNKIKEIKDIHIKLLRLPFEFYLEAASDEIKQIVETFDKGKTFIEITKKPTSFIEKAEIFVLIALTQLNKLNSGKRLLKKLTLSLSKKEHYINIKSTFSYIFHSLRIVIDGDPTNGYLERIQKQKNNLVNIPPVEILSTDILMHYKARKGSSSALEFPVLMEDGVDPQDHIKDLSKNPEKIESAIGLMISGNFSFTEDLKILYTPAFIEIAHEFVHALHSSEGTNATEIPVRGEDDEIWTNLEEYRAITGVPPENSFGIEFGLEKRFGHEGLPFITVFEKGIKSVKEKLKSLKKN